MRTRSRAVVVWGAGMICLCNAVLSTCSIERGFYSDVIHLDWIGGMHSPV